MIQGHKPNTDYLKLARDCSPQWRDSSAKLSTEGLLSLLWKHLVLFTLGAEIEVCADL